jgi:hypothetical protein
VITRSPSNRSTLIPDVRANRHLVLGQTLTTSIGRFVELKCLYIDLNEPDDEQGRSSGNPHASAKRQLNRPVMRTAVPITVHSSPSLSPARSKAIARLSLKVLEAYSLIRRELLVLRIAEYQPLRR